MRRSMVLAATLLVVSGVGPVRAASPTPSTSAAPTPSAVPSSVASVESVQLPAGVQYLEPVEHTIWDLPTTSTWNTSVPRARADRGGQVEVILGTKGRQIHAAIRDASGGWIDSLVDRGAGVRVTGYATVDGVYASSVAAGDRGFVVTGVEGAASPGHLSLTRLGFSWFSVDGRRWTRWDARTVLGADAAFVPTSLITTSGGWLMTGSLTSRDLRRKASIVTLASTDGARWKVVSRLSDRWSLTASELLAMGDRIALAGDAWVCSTDGFMLNVSLGNPMLRLWTSGDGGRTWTEGDSTAGGVITLDHPTPKSARGCTAGTNAYATRGSFLGVVGGRAVALSAAHDQVATSTDLRTWTVGTLEGAQPTGGYQYTTSASSLVATTDGNGLAILSLEARRDASDALGPFGSQVLAWRSPDGSAWSRVRADVPLEVTPEAYLIASPDDTVYLFDQNVVQTGCGDVGCTYDRGPRTYRQSVAGPHQPQPPCVPGPSAACAFATIDGSLAGADLTGIDLYAAIIGGTADLSGAKLVGARLIGATFQSGASLAGADLSGADLSRAAIASGVGLGDVVLHGADLTSATIRTSDTAGVTWTGANLKATNMDSVDLTGVSLKGAHLDGTFVDQTYLDGDASGAKVVSVFIHVGPKGAGLAGHDFGRMDLAGSYISGPSADAPGDLTHVDLRHAKVQGLGFSNVDLTGARFPPAARSQVDFGPGLTVYFADGVICPDGRPATKVDFSYDCRIGK